MNQKYKNLIYCFVLIGLLDAGCKKFVDVGVPSTQIVTTSVFNNDNSSTAAQLVVYSKMINDPEIINKQTGLAGDELYTYTTNQSYKDLYANALITTDANVINEWAPGYSYIYYENAILENLQNSLTVSQKVKQQLTGEAMFIRAWWYFSLTNLYGDIPLILTTDYKSNTAMARNPQPIVYQQIIADLKKAQGLLNSNYVDATDTAITLDRARPTSWAATAMLARVYLYAGKNDSAELQANSIINNPIYSLSPLSGSNSVFKKNSAEAIWQLIPQSSNGYTPEGSDYIILTAPPPSNGVGGNLTVSTQLLNAFEQGDLRKANWIGSITNSANGIIYYFPNKYKSANTSSLPATEYSMILRLGEQYLIRAEARARQNKLSGAISDLNVIRNRASLPLLDISLNNTQILVAIAHERQIELFTEGHRWFDLKRTNAIDSVMNKVSIQKGNTWKSYQQIYPVPQESINNGINITQNSGY